ncbi:alanine-zipper protein [Ligilactobacillus equi]
MADNDDRILKKLKIRNKAGSWIEVNGLWQRDIDSALDSADNIRSAAESKAQSMIDSLSTDFKSSSNYNESAFASVEKSTSLATSEANARADSAIASQSTNFDKVWDSLSVKNSEFWSSLEKADSLTLDGLKTTQVDLEQIKREVDSQSKATSETISQAISGMVSTSAQADKLSRSLSLATSEINSAWQSNSTSLSNLAKGLDSLSTGVKSTTDSLTATYNDQKGKVATLTTDVNGLKGAVKDNEDNINSLSLGAKGMSASISNAQGDINTLQADADGLKQEVAKKVDNTTYQTGISNLNNQINLKAAKSYVDSELSKKANSAELSVTNEKIEAQASRISSVTTTISGVSSVANNALSKANSAQSTADSATTKADDANSKIDNLSIGGRNLLTGTSTMTLGDGKHSTGTFRRSTGGEISNFTQEEVDFPEGLGITSGIKIKTTVTNGNGFCQDHASLQAGTYTLTYWVKGNIGDRIQLQTFWNSNVTNAYSSLITINNYRWNRLSFTAELKTDEQDISIGYLYVSPQKAGNIVYVVGGQLEKGNKATDWSPSPEDVDGKINTAQSTANNAVNKADNAQNTANTGVSKADTAQSTADNAKSLAQTGVTKADNAQSTANDATTRANNAQSTANSANSKIDNLSVSGKNILRNTLNFGESLKEYQKGGSWNQGEWRTGGEGSITNMTLQDTSVSVNGFVASKKIEIANNPTIGANGYLFVQDDVPLAPNKDYTLSIYVMPTEDVTITMRLGLNNRKDFAVKASSDWTRISWTTRLGGGNNSVYFGVLNTTKNVWFILPQLEEGTVATKYLPNPSDQSEQINDLQNKTTPQQLIKTVTDTSQANHVVTADSVNQSITGVRTEITKAKDELTGKITTVETKVQQNANETKSTKDKAERLISSLGADSNGNFSWANNQKIDNALGSYQTIKKIDGKIDGLQVGGTNLLKGTQDFSFNFGYNNVDSSSSGVSDDGEGNKQLKFYKYNGSNTGVYFSKTLTVGQEYTLSFDAKVSSTATGDETYIRYGYEGFKINTDYLTTDWKRYSVTFTVDKARAFIIYSNTKHTVYVRKIQLEKGNKATDWSPAPEDVEGKINGVQNNLTSYKVEVSNTYAKASSVYTKSDVDGITKSVKEQTADSIKSEIDNLSIGGRNLLKDTDLMTDANYWNLRNLDNHKASYTGQFIGTNNIGKTDSISVSYYVDYVPKVTFEQSSEYTISVWRYAGGSFDMYLNKDDGTNHNHINSQATVRLQPSGETNGVFKRYVATFKPTVTEAYITFQIQGSTWNMGFQLEKGNKATDWSPSPEDVAYKSQMLQKPDGWSTVLSDNYGRILSGLALDGSDVRFKGNHIHLDGQTIIDNSIIKSAMIDSIDATKIKAGSIDGQRLRGTVIDGTVANFKNVNVSTLTGGYIDASHIRITGSSQIANAVIGTAQIADGAITSAKIGSLDAGKITVGTLKGIDIQGVNVSGSTFTSTNMSSIPTGGAVVSSTSVAPGEIPKPALLGGNVKHETSIGSGIVSLGNFRNTQRLTMDVSAGAVFIDERDTGYVNQNIITTNTSGGLMWKNNHDFQIDTGITSQIGSEKYYGVHFKHKNDIITVGPGGIISWAENNKNDLRLRATSNVGLQGDVIFFDSADTKTRTFEYGGDNNGRYLNLNTSGNLQVRGMSGFIVNSDSNFGGHWVGMGSLSVSGSKNSSVQTSKGWTLINAYETAEYYFGDLGIANTGDGCKIKIMLDPLFKETINLKERYHAFVSPYGNAKVWVSKKTENYFVVQSDTPNIEFSWEIKAKRLGYENRRLELDDDMERQKGSRNDGNQDGASNAKVAS